MAVRSVLLAAATVTAAAAAAAAATSSSSRPAASAEAPSQQSAASGRPNFIWMITDDQDDLLGSYDVMPNLRKFLLEGGTKYQNAFVASPKCCPSRTSALAGRFAHGLNDETLGWCGDFLSRENETFVSELKKSGYQTGFAGKYFNEEQNFCGKNIHVPEGYDDFFAMCEEVRYYNITYNDNGSPLVTGDAPEDYHTAVVGNHSLKFLQTALPPFYAYIAPHAPHLPATPAPWYAGAPVPSRAPRLPNYNVGMEDKHWQVAGNAPMDAYTINASDTLFSDRLRALMSVDDLIGDIFALLDARGLLDTTYFVYTSDHGYQLGSFAQWCEKSQPYEHVSHIPFLARGPGIPANASSPALVNPIDIGATVLELAGVTKPGQRTTDGRSLVPLFSASPSPWPRDRTLIEYFGWTQDQAIDPCTTGPHGIPGVPCPPPPGAASAFIDAPSNTFSALRIINATMNFLIAEYRPGGSPHSPASTNFTEVYDLSSDPYQMTNIASTIPRSLLTQLSAELWAVASCQGDTCP